MTAQASIQRSSAAAPAMTLVGLVGTGNVGKPLASAAATLKSKKSSKPDRRSGG